MENKNSYGKKIRVDATGDHAYWSGIRWWKVNWKKIKTFQTICKNLNLESYRNNIRNSRLELEILNISIKINS